MSTGNHSQPDLLISGLPSDKACLWRSGPLCHPVEVRAALVAGVYECVPLCPQGRAPVKQRASAEGGRGGGGGGGLLSPANTEELKPVAKSAVLWAPSLLHLFH